MKTPLTDKARKKLMKDARKKICALENQQSALYDKLLKDLDDKDTNGRIIWFVYSCKTRKKI